MESELESSRHRVAVVGGGITGATAASALASAGFEVVLYDQGQRGPGGRASHRSVQPSDGSVLADMGPVPQAGWEFDHGCQFARADTPRMRGLFAEWCSRGWAAEWRGRFGRIGAGDPSTDFFGVPSDAAPIFVGVGGMQRLPRAVLGASAATVQAGVRVARLERLDPVRDQLPRWVLHGVGGPAAFHDTAEAEAAAAPPPTALGTFDAVLLTDVSSSFESWHRASAGVPEGIAARVQRRVRVPLFSCMVVLPTPLPLPLDGITFGGEGPLWWAARTSSKPGLASDAAGGECWTLVSTPAYAVAEVERVPMQDPETGAFRPQEDGYLNAEPGPALYAAFVAAVTPRLPPDAAPLPPREQLPYLQAQRWGSAFPSAAGSEGRDEHGRGPTTRTVAGVAYETGIPPLTYAGRADGAEGLSKQLGAPRDFIADDAQALYYAGDYCSHRPPGFEAACLSGLDAAEHLIARWQVHETGKAELVAGL